MANFKGSNSAPVWAVFGDLMSGLLGAFVLILVGVLVAQMDLVASLQTEMEKRRQEEQRRMALEKALAIPLQTGRVTLSNGRIGISGNVLFPVNSDELRPEGRLLLESLVPALQVYLGERDEMLMVSGFTDDKPIREGNLRFADNLELSAQRALTVARVLRADEDLPQRPFVAHRRAFRLWFPFRRPAARPAARRAPSRPRAPRRRPPRPARAPPCGRDCRVRRP